MEWSSELELGNKEIDTQHRALFAQFNLLSRACHEEQGKELILDILDGVERHFLTHFDTEERLMTQHAYSGTQQQRQEHQKFIREIAAFRHTVQTRGISRKLAAMVTERMVMWVVRHIRNYDRQMVDFFRQDSGDDS